MQRMPYHEDLAIIPFMPGRHGQSIRNAGDLAQGSGEELPGQPPNDLTELGRHQVRAAYAALAAAGVSIQQVNSSELPRARQSAKAFVDAHPHPKPLLASVPVRGLKEVSQAGWSAMYDREDVADMREKALKAETAELRNLGLTEDIEGHVAWTMRLGRTGEAPLAAALRGITALEAYGVSPGELIFSHAMLNRYMDAIATRASTAERAHLLRLLQDSSAVGKIAVLQALRKINIPIFSAADDKRNQQANGGVTEYTVDLASGRWLAGRRIEPPKSSDTYPFVLHERGEDGMWKRITPSNSVLSQGTDNE